MSHAAAVQEFFHVAGKVGIPLSDTRTILRLAGRLQSIAVAECNRELTEREKKDWERIRARLHAISTAVPLFDVHTGGDPRGSVVKVVFRRTEHHHLYNTMGGRAEGWAVPTSLRG